MSSIAQERVSRRYDHQFQLRLPKPLFQRVKAGAKAKEQPVNSEIVAVLATAYPAPIEAESLNEALHDAAAAVLADWTRTLEALGQNPADNQRLASLADALRRAAEARP